MGKMFENNNNQKLIDLKDEVLIVLKSGKLKSVICRDQLKKKPTNSSSLVRSWGIQSLQQVNTQVHKQTNKQINKIARYVIIHKQIKEQMCANEWL